MNNALRDFLISKGADNAQRNKMPMMTFLNQAHDAVTSAGVAATMADAVALALAIRTAKFKKGLRFSEADLASIANAETVRAVLLYSKLFRNEEKFDVSADNWQLVDGSNFNVASHPFSRAVVVVTFAVLSILRNSPSGRAINLAGRLGYNFANQAVQNLPGTPVGMDRIPSFTDLVGILGNAFNDAVAVPFEYEGRQIILSLPSVVSIGMTNPVVHVMGDFGPEIVQLEKAEAAKIRKAVNDRVRVFASQYNAQLSALSGMSEGQRRVWAPSFNGG